MKARFLSLWLRSAVALCFLLWGVPVRAAYSFTSGSSQYFVGSSSSIYNFGDSTFSVSFWIKTTTTSNQMIVAKGANSASDKGWFIAVGNVTAGCIMASLKKGDGTNFTAAQRESVATVNDGAWHQVVVTFVTDSVNMLNIDLNLYIDGTLSQGTQTTLATYDGSSTSNLSIGCRGVPASPSNFLTGTVGEVGIWGVILGSGDIGALARGARPQRVRLVSLVGYFPLVRDPIEVMRGLGLTNTNTAVFADHPRMY